MSRKALSVLAALAIGILAGVAWIVLAEPTHRVPETSTPTDSPPPSIRSEAIEAPPHEATSTVAEKEVVQAAAPKVEVPSAAVAPVSEEDPRVVLFGMVTDAVGHAELSNASLYVAVTNNAGKRTTSKIEAGRYSIAGLEPGDWMLSFRWPGFQDFDRQVTLSRDETLHREDFVLERAWNIAILVQTPEGKILLGGQKDARSLPQLLLCAVATKDSPGARLPTTELTRLVNYGVGRFLHRMDVPDSTLSELPKEAIGYLTVLEPPPIHVSLVVRQLVIETKRVDSPIQSLTFTVSPERLLSLTASLVLRVVDGRTGQPIEGATIQLSNAQSTLYGRKSGQDGTIRIDNQAPGQYSVWANVPGYATETRLVDLEPGRETDLGAFALSSPSVISGRIVDSDGHPVAAQPSLRPYYASDPLQSLAQTFSFGVKIDSDGRFLIARCAPGRYLLVFGPEFRNPPAQNEPEWTVAPLLIDTRSGPAENLDVVLARGVGLTLKPTSRDVVGMDFRIMTTDGLPYRRGRFYDTNVSTLRIAPGAYDLVLSRDSTDIRRIPIRLGADGSSLDIAP